MSRILMVLSAADTLALADGTSHPTGYWAEEVSESHRVLTAAGAVVDVATPGAGLPVLDPISLDGRGGVDPADGIRYAADLGGIAGLESPLDLGGIDLADYDAILLPGGHAPMADLAHDADLGALLGEAVNAGIVVAALCHGLAGLLSATSPAGDFLFAGRALTAFSDEEENTGGLGEAAPYLLAQRLSERGAEVDVASPWSSHVVVDQRGDSILVTGQNPQSTTATAQRLLEVLARTV